MIGDELVRNEMQKLLDEKYMRKEKLIIKKIPKTIIEMAKIKENDKISIEVKDGNIVILPIRNHKSLEDRIKEYEGKYECEEWC